jgi:hypothetical protein
VRRAPIALVLAAVALLAGCRGEGRPQDQDVPVVRQFDDVESTLFGIEADLDDD